MKSALTVLLLETILVLTACTVASGDGRFLEESAEEHGLQLVRPSGQAGTPETPLAADIEVLEEGRAVALVTCFRHVGGVLVIVRIVTWNGEGQDVFSAFQVMPSGSGEPIVLTMADGKLVVRPNKQWEAKNQLEVCVEWLPL